MLVAIEARKTTTVVARFMGEEVEIIMFGVEDDFFKDAIATNATFKEGDLGTSHIGFMCAGKLTVEGVIMMAV